MILEPTCSKRHCKHFLGIKQDDGVESTERPFCAAFEDRIPNDIAYGSDKHMTPTAYQGNDIVFEKQS